MRRMQRLGIDVVAEQRHRCLPGCFKGVAPARKHNIATVSPAEVVLHLIEPAQQREVPVGPHLEGQLDAHVHVAPVVPPVQVKRRRRRHLEHGGAAAPMIIRIEVHACAQSTSELGASRRFMHRSRQAIDALNGPTPSCIVG